ncbi:hypothetical protein EMCRGX_G026745 [Ephydatia muelleri]
MQRALIPLQRQQGGARFGLFGLESWDWLRLGMDGDQKCTGASDPPAAAKKLDAKEDLKQLSDQLREMKEDAFSNTMRFTIQNALMGKIEVGVYCDEWPQFKAVAARITSPTVADVVLFTKKVQLDS